MNEVTLAELVEANPRRARIFEALDLDYCCGGARTLDEACEGRDIEPEEVLERLEEAEESAGDAGNGEPREWESLSELVDIIMEEHHCYLRNELEPLGDLVDKVASVHGDSHPELAEVRETYHELAREMPVHLSEEEQLLFPAVRDLEEAGEVDEQTRQVVEALLEGLWDDHEATAEHLERLHELTDGYTVPDGACRSYRSMLRRLEELQANTHLHVHRENNVLFEAIESGA